MEADVMTLSGAGGLGELGTKKAVPKKTAPKKTAPVKKAASVGTTVKVNPRPTSSYVRAGDVIRVQLTIDTWTSGANAGFRNALNSNNLPAKSFDDSKLSYFSSGDPLWVEVTAKSDYSDIADVANAVFGIALANGYNPIPPANASFVSKVEDTGTATVQPASKPPVTSSGSKSTKSTGTKNAGNGDPAPDSSGGGLSDLFNFSPSVGGFLSNLGLGAGLATPLVVAGIVVVGIKVLKP